jgi:hypothetical protein
MQTFVKTFTNKTPHLRPAGGSHDKILPRLWLLVRTRSLRLRPLVRTSSFRLRLRRGQHVEVGARDLGPTRTWRCPNARAPPRRHARLRFSTPCKHPSWQDAWRSALTEAVTPHCSPARPPTRRPVQPLQHATPVRTSTEWPSTGGTYLHLGLNVAGLISTQRS